MEKGTDASATSDNNEVADGVLGDNYVILKNRLEQQAKGLFQKASRLNDTRKGLFGASVFELRRKHKLITENNCVPVDMVHFDGTMVLGYDVYFGLRTNTIADTFALFTFENDDFTPVSKDSDAWTFLKDAQFAKDHSSLMEFNKGAKLLQLRQLPSKFLTVFQTGSTHTDTKVFRWLFSPPFSLEYIDDFGREDNVYPVSHDFEWVETTAADFVRGTHPHVNIENRIFVETVGGDLTIKVDDNTEDGEGIYSEPVDDLNQTLDDGKISYAIIGELIILKMVPRLEEARYFVFNTLTNEVIRDDSIAFSCIRLPEGQGVIFPRGYVLSEGSYRQFTFDTDELEYSTQVQSPNGEDVLFVYQRKRDGRYLLLQYNLVTKSVRSPIECHGYTILDNGTLLFFKAKDEPSTSHEIQIWNTPFCSDEVHQSLLAEQDPSFLRDIGNAELVRAISDIHSLNKLVMHPEPTMDLYRNLVRSCDRIQQNYSWLSHEDSEKFDADIGTLRQTAAQIIDEFDKVDAQRKRATRILKQAQKHNETLLASIIPQNYRSIEAFMEGMGTLDQEGAQLRGLTTTKFIDQEALSVEIKRLDDRMAELCTFCAQFLQKPDAFKPLWRGLEEMERNLERVKKTKEIQPLVDKLNQIMDGLNVLTEAKERLQVDDIEIQTQITQSIQEVRRKSNQVKFAVDNHHKRLRETESALQFAADISLFDSEMEAGIARSETPEDCDEALSRLSGILDDLDARFGDVDKFIAEIDEKRESLQAALFTKKQTLLEARQKRVNRLFNNAKQIIDGLTKRTFKDIGELKNFFATDRRIQRVQKMAGQIADLFDPNKSEELLSSLKSTEQDALRKLRDDSELFEGGSNVLKFGSHRFAVNTQPFDLTITPMDDHLTLHITNTDFHEAITDPRFEETKPYWNRSLFSENDDVYRGEYLAASFVFACERGEHGFSESILQNPDKIAVPLAEFAALSPTAGYTKGVHDDDALKIAKSLIELRNHIGVLRFSSKIRAAGVWWWNSVAENARSYWIAQATSYGRMQRALGSGSVRHFAAEIGREVEGFLNDIPVIEGLHTSDHANVGEYLAMELGTTLPKFAYSIQTESIHKQLRRLFQQKSVLSEIEMDLGNLKDNPLAQRQLAHSWITAGLTTLELDAGHIIDELVALWCTPSDLWRVQSSKVEDTVKGLLGQHPNIDNGTLHIRYDEFLDRLTKFHRIEVPGFKHYRALRHTYLEEQIRRLRLEEFKPKVLTSFVRNKLINDVYLHLIGDNLAKQIGASGDSKRTDLMGMLLLISPPGYGKTTLMEYVASRLGMAFVKVNGPSLGHSVVSLDPSEAPNATAKQEVEKINLSFEMANNVMLYLDDIQHTHPELLQKFISLCDGQRRIEGVWNGHTRTYDLRGKRFCVVMAGNPYTETGEKFRIPDMLANRADIYNLGDQLSGKEAVFALSYIENALTSNRYLADLTTRSQKDIYLFARMAEGEEISLSELSHEYSAVERDNIVQTMKWMMRCRDVLLKVNAEYIFSAAQDESLRVEPPFKLQGSYRNMAKLAEKLAPALNQSEVDALISDHYRGESQTLTTGARSNLLKLAEMRGILTEAEETEWARIKDEFLSVKRMGGSEDDPMARMTGSLSLISDQLKAIPSSMSQLGKPEWSAHLASIQSALSGLSSAQQHWQQNQDSQWDSVAKILASGVPIQVQSMPELDIPYTPASSEPAEPTQELTELSDAHADQSLATKALEIFQSTDDADDGQPDTPFVAIIEEIKDNLQDTLHPEMYAYVMMTLQQALSKLEKN